MATTLTGATISAPRVVSIKVELPKPRVIVVGCQQRRSVRLRRLVLVASSPSTPPNISEKVANSIKDAEATCEEDAASGECAAAWDEVEELSAAASHARDKLKEDNDPLEKYCKDNPEADECRTYED